MTDYLDRLAQVAAEVRVDTLPGSTVEAAKRVLLDTLGAIVAGSALPENHHLARLAAARAPHGVATLLGHGAKADAGWATLVNATAGVALGGRSEEHTSELQSPCNLVCRLLLEKKKKTMR